MGRTGEAIERVAERYGLGTVATVSRIEEGTVNDCYEVVTASGTFVVKFLGYDVNERQLDQRMYEKLDLEFRVLEYLEDSGFRYEVPTPLENEYGNRLSRIDGDYVTVAHRIPGRSPTEPDRTQRRAIGAGLGRYHAAVEGFPEAFDYDDDVLPWLRELLGGFAEEAAGDRREMVEFFSGALRELADRGLEAWLADPPEVVPGHADFQPDNLLFEGDELVGVVDFDNIRPQPPLVDLAWTISTTSTCYDGTAFDGGAARDVVEGYASVRSLSEEERRLLLPAVVLHHGVRFALGYRGGSDADSLREAFERAAGVRSAFGTFA